MGAMGVGTVAGCGGGGHKSASITASVHSDGPTPMPPIYPGTTVSIPPSDPSSDPSSTPSTVASPVPSTTTPSTTTRKGPATSFAGDGTFRVGVDIQPGTYRSEGGAACYWERLKGLSGSIDDMIDNGVAGPKPVQIMPSDFAFKTQACGSWSLASSGTSTATTPPAGFPSGN
jgi:hypothetical protein